MLAADLAQLLRVYFGLDQLASEIVASIIVFALTIFVGWSAYFIFRRYLSGWAKKTKTKVDDEILRNIKTPAILLAVLFGAYYSLEALTFIIPYSGILGAIFTIVGILVVTFIITRVINVLISWYATRAERRRKLSEHLLFVLKKSIQAVVYIFAFLAILVAFKIDLSGLVVGLGVGGIAIALALQNVLSDVFSAFSIYFDRPFEVGDFIVVGDYSGTVKKIGIKSTRVQLLQGEELVMSNRQLTTANVRNFRKLKKRRIVFKLGVTCDTPVEKLRKIPDIISGIIGNTELAELDRVHFTEFGDFSYNFEVVYYMKTPDYVKYRDTQQAINFSILEAFKKEGIEMPFPTQTIFVNK
ncbi:MAG: mechanosensitive ion channel family protein [Candidatus Bathyarchaeota archaeon]|jgi:small-conductance mechanosensitive channel|nr:mechanosensitive ion channel family protein [Candidatus Bathyarchaeota archaeon]